MIKHGGVIIRALLYTDVAKRVLPRLFLITSASTCLKNSRNLGSTLLATSVYVHLCSPGFALDENGGQLAQNENKTHSIVLCGFVESKKLCKAKF